jgi:hypothetical protein
MAMTAIISASFQLFFQPHLNFFNQILNVFLFQKCHHGSWSWQQTNHCLPTTCCDERENGTKSEVGGL